MRRNVSNILKIKIHKEKFLWTETEVTKQAALEHNFPERQK